MTLKFMKFELYKKKYGVCILVILSQTHIMSPHHTITTHFHSLNLASLCGVHDYAMKL